MSKQMGEPAVPNSDSAQESRPFDKKKQALGATDLPLTEATVTQSSPEYLAKEKEVRAKAAEREHEIRAEFDLLDKETQGWADAKGQIPKMLAGRQVQRFIEKLSQVSGDDAHYLLNPTIYRSIKKIAENLKKNIEVVNRFDALPADEKTELEEEMVMLQVKSAPEARSVFSDSDWKNSHAQGETWESSVKEAMHEGIKP